MRWTRRRLIALAALAAVALAPGWRAVLVPVPHAEVLAAARASSAARVFGISLSDAPRSERWHAQYVDRALPVICHDFGVQSSLPSLLPPDFVAHLAAGAERADGYFRVVTSTHWPWWRPGGGVAWEVPGTSQDG